ncbi:MAG TPA: peroxidase family protein, partial [Solirubrobacteraceae bacterium]|nr:peroxidase family protein [Solirubrobacteraceae bacterium]
MADNPIGSIRRKVFEEVGKHVSWWELPLPAQLAALAGFRDDLRQFNLYDTETPEPNGDGDAAVATAAPPPPYRTYDGSQTDPAHPDMGKTGMRFGRNVPPETTYPEEQSMLDPSPREVSTHLLNRDTFKPATSLNVLAAAWLQFQNHDWFSHGDNSETEFLQVPLSSDDDWDGGTMEVRRTSGDSTNSGGNLPPTYVNKVTPWWDGSQLYGSTEERNRELRSGEDGKLNMDDGRLPEETDKNLNGIDLTGFSDNYWVGLSVMHTLFA